MLKNEGKEIYKELADYLERHSTCEKVDEFVLTELAMYFQTFFESAKLVGKSGAVQTYKKGTEQESTGLNGAFTAMTASSKNISALCTKLGIYDILKHKLHTYGKVTAETSEYLK